jgi:hypothetical protein
MIRLRMDLNLLTYDDNPANNPSQICPESIGAAGQGQI